MLKKETKMFMGILACMMLLVGWQSGNKGMSTEERFTNVYLGQLEEDAQAFAEHFGIKYLTDEVKGDLVRLLNEVNAHSKSVDYNAQSVDYKTENTYNSGNTSDVMSYMSENLDKLAEDFYDKNGDGSDMTEEEYDKAWADAVIDHCHDQLDKAEATADRGCHSNQNNQYNGNYQNTRPQSNQYIF